MFETLWPRLRTYGRLVAFLIGLAAIGVGVLSIIQTPVIASGNVEPTRQIASELLLIAGGALWMLLITKL